MTHIENVKRVANEFMELQLRFFSEMSALNEDEFGNFMEWFGKQPQNLMIKSFGRALFESRDVKNHPRRNTTTRNTTSD